VYFLIEVRRILSDSGKNDRYLLDTVYKQHDPWGDDTEIGREYFERATAMLDAERAGKSFGTAFDIGCAEGAFTEILAARCQSVIGVDISPVAISRAENRKVWGPTVRFHSFDLRTERVPNQFDLIVCSGVLEYFNSPTVLMKARTFLVEGLKTGGLLQIGTTRANPVVEKSWWGRRLNRGRWINVFIGKHPALHTVANHLAASYDLTLYRKI
jgi:SAM-dependent methyltransferase